MRDEAERGDDRARRSTSARRAVGRGPSRAWPRASRPRPTKSSNVRKLASIDVEVHVGRRPRRAVCAQIEVRGEERREEHQFRRRERGRRRRRADGRESATAQATRALAFAGSGHASSYPPRRLSTRRVFGYNRCVEWLANPASHQRPCDAGGLVRLHRCRHRRRDLRLRLHLLVPDRVSGAGRDAGRAVRREHGRSSCSTSWCRC